MRPAHPLRHFLLAAGSSLLAATPALHAQSSGTWGVDANGLWSVTGNWLSGTVADGSGNSANFTNDITADRTVSLDTDRTLTSVVFGDSTLNLNGDFIFDLTGASTTAGNFWNIVNVANLTETFGSTFQVLSTLGAFTEVSDVWSIVENGTTYQFSQATGVLSVIPEPSSALAGILLGLGLLRRRRL